MNQQNSPQIDHFITQRIRGAIKLSEVSSEISYQLPNSAVSYFKDFFCEMDRELAELEIKSYGISVTTLEEVFLKVGDGLAHKDKFDNHSINASPDERENDDYCLVDDSVKGISLKLLQLKAMIAIRLKMTIRELRVLFLEIFYPTLLIIISAIILSITNVNQDKLASMSLSKIPTPQTVTYSFDPTNLNEQRATTFMNQFYGAEEDIFTLQPATEQYTNENVSVVLESFDQYISENTERGENFFSVYIRDIQETETEVTYDLITLVDPTQEGAPGYAVLATMNSIFREVTGDPSAYFDFSRGPFPRSKFEDNLVRIILSMITVFSFSVSMGIITSSMAGNI